jgi:hypothetical protein
MIQDGKIKRQAWEGGSLLRLAGNIPGWGELSGSTDRFLKTKVSTGIRSV